PDHSIKKPFLLWLQRHLFELIQTCFDSGLLIKITVVSFNRKFYLFQRSLQIILPEIRLTLGLITQQVLPLHSICLLFQLVVIWVIRISRLFLFNQPECLIRLPHSKKVLCITISQCAVIRKLMQCLSKLLACSLCITLRNQYTCCERLNIRVSGSVLL